MLVNKKMLVLAGILVMLFGSVGTVWAVSCLSCHVPTADSYHDIMAPQTACVDCHPEGGEDPPLVITYCENCHSSVPPDPPPIVTKCAECHVSGCEGIAVNVDIKPGSCPNPLNVNSRGVLSVAILGTASFDASFIDPASVELNGVSPLRWAAEDVATPYNGAFHESAMDCTEAGPDGLDDMVLFFDTPEVVAAIGEVSDGEVLELTVTGNLLEEYGGTPITGYDFVIIMAKGM